MVLKLTAPVRRHVTEYLAAFEAFSHNARVYLASAFLQSVGGSMVGTVFALYVMSTGMRESTVGYVEGAIGIATAVVALVGPLLVATLGYRALMLGALGLLIASRFAQALMPTATALIGLGLVVGLGDGFLRTVNSAFLAENSGHGERTHLFSSEFLVRMLAIFAGGIIGGFLPSIVGGSGSSGFQWTITAGAVVMGLGMVPMAFVREKVHGVKGFWRVSVESMKGFSAWGHLGRIAAPQSFLVAAGAMTGPFVPLYLRHTLGASVQQIGFIQGFGALVVGIAAFVTPMIARKFGHGAGVTLLQLGALPLLFAVPYVGGLLYGVVLLYVRSTLMGISGPLCNELSMEGVKTQDKPLVGGGLFFTLSIMGFLGNVVGGRLMEVSYTAPYIPAAFLYGFGTMLTYLLWVYVPGRRAAAAAEPVLEMA